MRKLFLSQVHSNALPSKDGDFDLKLPVAKALAMVAMEKAMMLNVSAVIAIMDR